MVQAAVVAMSFQLYCKTTYLNNILWLMRGALIVILDVQDYCVLERLVCILSMSAKQFLGPLTIMCWHIFRITHGSWVEFWVLCTWFFSGDLSPLCLFIWMSKGQNIYHREMCTASSGWLFYSQVEGWGIEGKNINAPKYFGFCFYLNKAKNINSVYTSIIFDFFLNSRGV